MAIHTNVQLIRHAVQLACQDNPAGALQCLQPLALSPAQYESIAAIFRGITDPTDAPQVQRTVFSILSRAVQYSLLDLPPEDLLTILSSLNWEDISACALVCQELYQTAQTDVLCREIYQREFQADYPTRGPSLDFYRACRNGHTSQRNFLNGVYAKRQLRGYPGDFRSLAAFDGKVVSGDWNGVIKIWNSKVKACLNTLRGHYRGVSCLAIADGKLVSGSWDRTIRIWDLKMGTCLNTLVGHQDEVISFAFSDGKVISGSCDHTIRIWDLETGVCLNTLREHQGEVCALTVFNGKLISGSWDRTIKIWDLKTGTCIKTLLGHQDQVSSFVICNGKLVSGSVDCTIKIWDLETGICLNTLEGHQRQINYLATFNGKVISSSRDGTIKIWDPETGACLTTSQGNQDGVYSFVFFNAKAISSTRDHSIKIWDFTAEHDVIFKELAKLFKADRANSTEEAMVRFSKMPEKAKNEIYKELYCIFAPCQRDDLRREELALYEQHWLSATSKQKAEAIERYIARLAASENQPEQS
jgi:hypothetical protein